MREEMIFLVIEGYVDWQYSWDEVYSSSRRRFSRR